MTEEQLHLVETFMSYVSNRLPYASQEDDSLNDKYKHFAKNGQQRAEALVKSSVTSSNPYIQYSYW